MGEVRVQSIVPGNDGKTRAEYLNEYWDYNDGVVYDALQFGQRLDQFEMKQGWQQEGDRSASQSAREWDELVNSVTYCDTSANAYQGYERPTQVLIESSLFRRWHVSADVALDDNVSRIDCEGKSDHQVDTVYDLYEVDQ